jgi:restriction system protein
MGRQKKSNFADDLIALVALMPWWVGVALALVLFVVLHHLASLPVPVPVVEVGKPLPLTPVFAGSVARGLALAGQYFLPLLCLAGAGLSYWKRRRAHELVRRATDLQDHDVVDGMTWREFERLVAAGFRRRGYGVVESGGDGPDGGVDVVLTKGGEKFLVQCKHWRAQRVGVDVVRELYGVMAARGATGGFVVTSGRFSTDAQEFSEGRNVKLIDGIGLRALLADTQPWRNAAAARAADQAARAETPACPHCQGPMVKRAARRGSSAGQEFWGCASFPKCRGTRAA